MLDINIPLSICLVILVKYFNFNGKFFFRTFKQLSNNFLEELLPNPRIQWNKECIKKQLLIIKKYYPQVLFLICYSFI